jgi:hypothetical protein
MYQTLVGDTADGYRGCPKVGPVKAEKILDTTVWSDGGKCADVYPMWPRVVAAYEKASLTEDDALVQARLVHPAIHRLGEREESTDTMDTKWNRFRLAAA